MPELARFFLTSNRLEAKSALFQHISPPNMDGLYSQSKTAPESTLGGGYDRTVLYGNFLVVSTALWSRPEVCWLDLVARLVLCYDCSTHVEFCMNVQASNDMD
jgi:hypothetical protein